MKLCISTLVCPTWALDRIAAVASQCKIEGVDFRGLGTEIDITKLPEFTTHLPSTLELFRSHGLAIPGYNTSVTLISPAAPRWEAMLEEFQRYAQLAQQTRTLYVRVFGGGVPKELSRDEALIMAQRHLRQLIKIARAHQCIPLVETHDDWASSERMMELVHEFDPQETGVLWDIEHPCRNGEKPIDTAQRMKKFIRHVHFKDGFFPDGKRQPQLLGHGDLPLGECLEALKQIGYEGWLCLECEKRWHSSAPDPEYSIPQFEGFVKGILS